MTAKPNRQEYDFTPIKGATIFTRQAHPRAPVELVISHGGSAAIVYEMTDDQVDTNGLALMECHIRRMRIGR